MGCWPIGGPFFAGDQPLGYANADDAESIRTLHTALDAGVTLFDTAAVYGAGNAERLIGRALADRPEAMIVTKIGLAFDEDTKQLTGEETAPEAVLPAIDRCLARLNRDRIDILLLHINMLPMEQAAPIFDRMEAARAAGKIRAYGWSTDSPHRATAWPEQEGFVAVEHAMNVLRDTPTIQQALSEVSRAALIRSPLAMGVLTGKFDRDTQLPADDNRSRAESWRDYFRDGKVEPKYLDTLAAIRELLQTGGRTLSQGALGWLWARGARNIPLPGARTVRQMQENAGALVHGPLPADVMAEIETLVPRPPEQPDTAK
jgi:aryl-alcohol dehydrogenase-like predicted oxidoreductase